MKTAVVGFAFDTKGENVVLIRKDKPSWQKGRLNGVGGKIEEAEDRPILAMVREFREETGVETTEDEWRQFHFHICCDAKGNPYFMFYGFALFNDGVFAAARTMEAEPIEKHAVASLLDLKADKKIYNLNWLLPLARDPYVTSSYAKETENDGLPHPGQPT